MVDNRVMRNLPPLYHDIKEFEELTETEAIELNELDAARKKVEDEQFIMSVFEKGIKKRQNGVKIRADPATETLDFRRLRLINRQSTKAPLTERKVTEILTNLVGASNFEEDLDIVACTSDFIFEATEQSVTKEIDETLERVLPLNIFFRIIQRMRTNLHFPCTALSGEETTVFPWNQTLIEVGTTHTIGTASQMVETSTVYPKQ